MSERSHAEVVDAWLKRTARGASSEGMVRLFGAALGAVWAPTQTMLGDLTLRAIAERVLQRSSEKHPVLAAIKVQTTGGIQLDGLGPAHAGEVKEALRFMLVELLTVLGRLTAELLTPELHAALSKVARPAAARSKKEAEPRPLQSAKTTAGDRES